MKKTREDKMRRKKYKEDSEASRSETLGSSDTNHTVQSSSTDNTFKHFGPKLFKTVARTTATSYGVGCILPSLIPLQEETEGVQTFSEAMLSQEEPQSWTCNMESEPQGVVQTFTEATVYQEEPQLWTYNLESEPQQVVQHFSELNTNTAENTVQVGGGGAEPVQQLTYEERCILDVDLNEIDFVLDGIDHFLNDDAFPLSW